MSACALSPCQRYVACVDLHNDHRVIIYNIKKNKELLCIEGGKDKINHLAWSLKPDDLRFATVGLKEVKFWNPADSSKRLNIKGIFGQKYKMTSFACICFDTEGNAYTAGANGYVYVWNDQGVIEKVIKAHGGEVTALAY